MSDQSRTRSRRLLRAPLHWLVVSALVCGGVLIAVPAQAAPAAAAGPVDAGSAADTATAAAIASRFHHPVTDLSSLTATTTAAVQPDGSTKLTISTEPVRVRRGADWVDVSTDLSKASDGMLVPTATPTPVEFSAGGSGPLARVQTPAGGWISVAAPLGTLPQGVVDGSSVTYPEVLPGVDLRLSATTAGMSEVLVVKTPKAASDPHLNALRFPIAGAQVRDGSAQDSATATASDGSVLVSPSPTWWDSAQGGDADGPGGAGLTKPVPADTTASSITVDASVPTRVDDVTYPAYVDPDWTGNTQAWTFVDSRYPTASYWLGANHGSDNEAHVGYIDATNCGCSDGAHLDRTYWQIDTSGFLGKHVTDAHFNTTELYSSACSTNTIDLDVTGPFSSATTWNTKPNIVWTASSASLGGQRSGCANQYGAGWNAMSVANAALQNNATSVGLSLRADNENDWTSWRRFSHAATLMVTYNAAPNTPANPLTKGQPCATASPGQTLVNSPVNTTALSVSQTDPDVGQNVGVVFNVWHANGTNALDPTAYPAGHIDSGSQVQGTISVVIPTNLADGAYMWNGQGYDGLDLSSHTPWCYFTIHNAPPIAPVVTSSVPTTATLTVGTPLTVTIAQGAATDGVVGFAYTWQTSAGAPTYSALPSCSDNAEHGGLYFVCGSTATIQTAPWDSPQGKLRVWAFNAALARSAMTTVTWSTLPQDPAVLSGSAHQWTTDLAGPVPAAQCPSTTTSVSCVADNNVPDPANQPNGQLPIVIPSGVSLDGSGAVALGGVAGVLNFSATSTTRMKSSPGLVVDTTKSFTVGAWLTPTAVNGTAQTAMAAVGQNNAGFALKLTAAGHWCFQVLSSSGFGQAVGSTAVTQGQPVFVAGVWDAINHEMRLYVNGSLASNQTYWPASPSPVDQGVTLGSGWSSNDFWNGQIANPVVVPGELTSGQLGQMANEMFFDNGLG